MGYGHYDLNEIIFIILFYLGPTLITIVLPVFIVPFLIHFFSKSRDVVLAFLPFTICNVVLAVLSNIIWESFIFNHIYFEWDRISVPVTFLTHEEPILDGSASWIAHGWSLLSLRILWLIMVITVYIVSGVFTLSIFKKDTELNNIILKSVIILSIISTLSLLFYFTDGRKLIF